MIPVEFRPAAAADIEEAVAWYEQQWPGLGDEFLTAITAAVTLIAENPSSFVMEEWCRVADSQLRGVSL